MENIKVIKENETRNFMEGDEHCKLYIDTDKIVFGTSTLLPGRKGAVDPGHKDAYEIFFVAKGTVLCNFPDASVFERLEEGDAVLIPPPRPHALVNIGESTAIVVWAQAKFRKTK
jgi:quercetin dioxygenase-like cupin family protein